MRYIVGIDLGTTNTTVAYVDTEVKSRVVQTFPILQTVAEGVVNHKNELPSFCYLTKKKELSEGALDLPWKKGASSCVGQYALDHGCRIPTRFVGSAKSWLSNRTCSPKEKLLPVEAHDEEERISPIEASCRYLEHIRLAWNHEIAKGNPELELEEQEVILTVPASFDEVARKSTAEAAKQAGFEKITFLEEPQAAFYHWISQNEKRWQESFEEGATILVSDVGGGTTDFSLIQFSHREGVPSFERMAVGEHLLLGGDNIDHALAYYIEEKIEKESGEAIGHDRWKALYQEARRAKEALLSDTASTYSVIIQGKGSSVVQGSLSTELSVDEVKSFLLEGFFSQFPWEDAIQLKKASALRTSGLPYEEESSITKQLAHFLHVHGAFERPPKYILFNGGTMMAPSFKQALITSFQHWFPETSLQPLSVKNPMQSVSRGAAYFGLVRRGEGVKIRSGSPRSFYLALPDQKAICLLPRGVEEGSSVVAEQEFSALANQPVNFTLYASHTRLHDHPGQIVSFQQEEFHQMPPISTLLRFGKKSLQQEVKTVPVTLRIDYTTLGTLELSLESKESSHRWNLEFQLKTSTGQEDQMALMEKGRIDETYSEESLQEAKEVIHTLFSKGGSLTPEKAMERLEIALQLQRNEWPPSLLRKLWDVLILQAENRTISTKHEARFWNLAGYLLRPGTGYPLDDKRIKDLWRLILSERQKKKTDEVVIQQWICFRRISGGLNKGLQGQLYHQIIHSIFNKKSGKIELVRGADLYQYQEKLRTLASFERLDFQAKSSLGKALFERIKKEKKGSSAEFFALGRLGARELLYGSHASVLPVETVTPWVEELLPMIKGEKQLFPFALMVRRAEANEINVTKELRKQVLEASTNDHLKGIIEGKEELNEQDQGALLGDQLPPGIVL